MESKSGVAEQFDKENWLCPLNYTADISHKRINSICSNKILTKRIFFKAYGLKAFSKKKKQGQEQTFINAF